MQLVHLIYVSSAVVPMDNAGLRALLEVSRDNNARDEITGMLLYHNGTFIQVIEGERNVVHDLYERLRRDTRHTNIMTLELTPIDERSFSNWTMGFNRLDMTDLSSIPGYTTYLSQPFEVNAFASEPDRARMLLAQFRESTLF